VRLHGGVADPSGLDRRDHVCWSYDDPQELGQVTRQFLLAGLERGERVMCVGEVAIAGVTEGPTALPDVDGLLRTGTLVVVPRAATYNDNNNAAAARRPLPERLAFYEDAVTRAADDGYSGLRIAAEVTALASEPTMWADQLLWERIADGVIAGGRGMATLCAYRHGAVDAELLAALSTVHPLASGPGTDVAFRLFFDDDVLTLTGAVDWFGATRLRGLLAATPVNTASVILDLSDLTFIDAAGCTVVAEWGVALASAGSTLHLRRASRTVRRVWGLLGFDGYASITAGASL
jgi:anti-anti-sigma regulatory factor